MRIYQPMLFIGLGGTGCKVGAELEKRLREELCGPDGTWLLNEMEGRSFLPYQLPSCLQFVYADLSAGELQRVRREVVPGREHDQAAQKTMRLITDLVPAGLGNSADVAQSLRINLDEDTVDWLPPKESDPRIGPLVRGAGQLPTVGRAVLFETVRRNPDTALLAIKSALSDINESGAHLWNVSGKRTQRVDPVIVFVVFSVAGGTGSGIYYDYLHLIGNLMVQGNKRAEIYPLVLMPSAFDDAQGGGRPADLNAGSALIDLYRLVDDQNAKGSPGELDARGSQSAVSVRYPRIEQVHLPPNMIQTAFLFGRPVGGVRRDDLHRSMVSLMNSLVGAGPTTDADEESTSRPHQSFADGFINSAVERYARAQTGVGRRGVTTSAVAALTIPLLEITDIISTHLLANAVTELTVPPGAAETNKPQIRTYIARAGLDRMLEAPPNRIPAQQSPVGYGPVLAALTDRANAMGANVERGQETYPAAIATLAQDFEPTVATEALLRELDFFRMRRAVFGHPDLTDPLDRGGFLQLLEGWQSPPNPPPGLNSATPPMPDSLPRKLMQRLRITDPPAQAVVRKQDAWYAWQTRRLYNAAWKENRRLWSRPWQAYVTELRAIHDQFLAHVQLDRQQFDARSKDLYKPRVGVAYLLPPEDRGLEGFYQIVLARLKQEHSQRLPPNSHEGHLLNVLLGAGGWTAAYREGRRDPEAAIGYLRQRIKEAVTEQLRPPRDQNRPALIPPMEDLLASAAVRRDKNVTENDLNRFRQKLAELVPGGFAPDGHAPLTALFTYPAVKEDPDIERFLRREVALPVDMLGEPEFRAVQADSMVVVLMRTSMGITEVPELRRVVKLWSEAQRHPHSQDYLSWRRRLRQDEGYLLMAGEDRQHVLHHLLCAAWDGKVIVGGADSDPDHITVEIGSREAVVMRLDLKPLGQLSSWASVLQAYEQWILTDDDMSRRSLAARLMSQSPQDADRSPAPPAPVFRTIVELADQESKNIEEAGKSRVLSRDPQLAVFREFWQQILPAALNQQVGTTRKSLLDLLEQVDVTRNLGR